MRYNYNVLEKYVKGGLIMGKRKSVLIILLFLVMTLFVETKSVFADDSKYKLEVNYGIDGAYKSGRYIPFEIKVTADEDFIGEVGVKVRSQYNNIYDSYNKEVSVEGGKSSTLLIPAIFNEGSESTEIELLDSKGNVVATKKVNITSGRINEYTISTGLLTEDKSSLSYLSSVFINDPTSGAVSSVKTLNISLDYLTDLGILIEGLDVIVINNYNLANLNEVNYKSLNNWIEKGGTLIIGSGANEGKTIKNINSDFIKVKTLGNKEESVELLGEKLNLITSNIELENSSPVYFGLEKNPLAYSLEKGSGKVIITTFDLGLEPFILSEVKVNVMEILFTGAYEKIHMNTMNNSWYSYNSLTEKIPVGEITSIKVILAVISIYAIIIGFVTYIVLKMINKRDLTWIIIPVISVVFTIIIYLFGSNVRFNDIVLNQNNIINVNENGMGTVKGYVGVSSGSKEELLIKNNENTLKLIKANDYYGYEENLEYKELGLKTLYKENGAEYLVGKAKSLETTSFEAIGGEIVLDKITHDLKIKDNFLEGSVTNNLDYDIEDLLIISNRSIWNVGYVKAKETKNLENLNISSYSGLQSYSGSGFSNKYYTDRYNDSKDILTQEYKNILRKSNLLSAISYDGTLQANSTKILAITEMPIDYNLNFNKKSTSEFNTTLIIQDINIDFKDESGLYNYPEGYFSGKYSYNNKEVYFDEYNEMLYGVGEAIINYKLGGDINFEEVYLSVKNEYISGAQEVEIFNLTTREYDKLTLTQERKKLDNLSDYLNSNNTIEIKIKVDDYKESNAIMPLISGKGRAK